MSTKTTQRIIAVGILFIFIGLVVFWFYYLRPAREAGTTGGSAPTTGFVPFGGAPSGGQGGGVKNPAQNNTYNDIPTDVKIPTLRLLSATPVGGYGATTTASTTIIHWVDRGRGNIIEARGDSLDITTLSNTLLPKTYESTWGRDGTSFIGSILGDNNQSITTLYATLSKHATTTSSVTPYELHGKNLPSTIVSYASSPKKDKVFLFAIEGGRGVGYIAPFAGGTATQIFTTPLTEVNIEWPEINTIAITTKGSAGSAGFLYFVDPKTGIWKKILGPLPGISTRVSHDAHYVLVSVAGSGNSVLTSIYSVAASFGTDAIIRTLADKCVWGNFYKQVVYCGVPFQPVSGTYPDDWYQGTLSTVDKIWQVNAVTSEVHLISSVFSEAKTSIDTYNLGLDDKDDYLFFMNKGDLSLWSLDLVSGK
jgi:hypothetical protein